MAENDAEKNEKARLADIKMAEMREKNEKLLKRYEEIEEDKRNANMLSKMAGLRLSDDGGGGADVKNATPPQQNSRKTHQNNHQTPPKQQIAAGGGRGGGSATNRPRNQGEGPPPDPKFNFLDDPGRKGDLTNYQRGAQNNSNRGRAYSKSHSMDVENKIRTPGGIGRGVMTKKDMELNMTGSERLKYQNWLNERAKIDAERLARQQTSSGEWRREWDAEKPMKRDGENFNQQKEQRRGGGGGGFARRQNGETAINQESEQKFNGQREDNRRGERGGQQTGNNYYRGGDNNRRPRRYSDSEEHPKKTNAFRNTAGRGRGGERGGFNNGQRQRQQGNDGAMGFSVLPANAGGGNLPPKSPRIDVDTVRFSMLDADKQKNNRNGFANDNRRQPQNRDAGAANNQERFRRGGEDSNRRSWGAGGGFSKFENNRQVVQQVSEGGSEYEEAPRREQQSKHNRPRNQRQPPQRENKMPTNEIASTQTSTRKNLTSDDVNSKPSEPPPTETHVSAAAAEEHWDEEVEPATGAELDDDQWEDVDEDDEEETSSPSPPRRRAISEEYRRSNSEGARPACDDYEDDDDGEEYGEPEEYISSAQHRGSSAVADQFEEAASDLPDADDDVHAASLTDGARERNESMDQIEREMIARLNENIEAAEAALGKHDEDFDMILYGARLDRDLQEPVNLNGVGANSTDVVIDNDVKSCVDKLLTLIV